MTVTSSALAAADAPPAQRPKVARDDPSFVSYLAVRQAMNALHRLQERYVVNQPASETQSYVCSMLVRAGRPLRMGDIAKFLCLEPQTITGLISRMEAKGLVRRVRSTTDRRQVLVDITDEGRASSAHAMTLTQTVRREAFAEMTVEEHVRLAAVMFGIRDTALAALGEDPADANEVMRQVFAAGAIAPYRTLSGDADSGRSEAAPPK
jgi:DNA-binding MarR family transcriptional regulator